MFFKPGAATDPIYSNTRDGIDDDLARGREYLERIRQESSPYVDADAEEKATRDLAPVFWELQLAHAVKSAGKNLVPRKSLAYKNNKGPDLFAADYPGIWFEAVVVKCGTGPDALQYPEVMKVYSYNPDGVVLRLRSVIRDKSKQIQEYIAAGIIKPDQAAVIAISGVTLPHRHSGIFPPEIVRSVYPVNNPVIEISRATMAVTDSYVEYRDRVKKSLGAEVETDIFLNPEFSHISAVLFDESDWVNPPSPPGVGFKLVHNSMATTPVPDGWFPVGDEYWWRDGVRLESRRHT
ncbi:MAG: hypothetical protein HY508_04550 [Acidobacteria bacterium]|nr:hypothetical protein [Acidobacteriota bacterium]